MLRKRRLVVDHFMSTMAGVQIIGHPRNCDVELFAVIFTARPSYDL